MKSIKSMVLVTVVSLVICLGNTVKAQDPDAAMEQLDMMRNFLSMMNEYLNISQKFVNCLKDDDLSVFLVAESMIELHEKKGAKLNAIPDLRKLADQYKDRNVVRKAILFKIKDIYKDNQQFDKAMEVLWEIAAIK